MTIEEIEMRRWLNRAFYADKKAQALERLAEQCRERAQGLTVNWECTDTGKSDSAQNGTENALMRLAEINEKAQVMKCECAEIIKEVFNAIKTLNNDDYEAILINRYINYYTIEQTAEVMHYAPRTVKLKQKKAIEMLVKKGESYEKDTDTV